MRTTGLRGPAITAAVLLGLAFGVMSPMRAQDPQQQDDQAIGTDAGDPSLEDWSGDRMQLAESDTIVTDEPVEPAQDYALQTADRTGASDGVDKEPATFVLQSSGDPGSVPLKFGGRLFFTKWNGKDATCSGQFIAPRIVLTAAHCVRDADSGQWNKNVVFALQYHEGKAAHRYRSRCIFTKSRWVKKHPSDKKERRWDYAMIVVGEDSLSGYFGWSYGYRGKYNQAVKIGYPGEIERGRIVQIERGPLNMYAPGLVAIRHNNPKSGKGSSGGAFVANFSGYQGPGSNVVLSVTSASPANDPNVDIGPYFDEHFKSMFDTAMRGC